MDNISKIGLSHIEKKELTTIKGGGLIADFVHWLKCDCNWADNSNAWPPLH